MTNYTVTDIVTVVNVNEIVTVKGTRSRSKPVRGFTDRTERRDKMNTQEKKVMKMRGSADVSYLGATLDQMIWEFMEEERIPGLTLAIVQAPYIPRVVGYGLADASQRRLASPNTLWPVGPISQAFAAVAAMQLFEDGKLDLNAPAASYLKKFPEAWGKVTVLELLRHSAGLPDIRKAEGFCPFCGWSFGQLIDLVRDSPLSFEPGTAVEQSATNFLVLTEIIEQVSGMSYHDFVMQRQIDFLGLRHTGFSEDLDSRFLHEDVSLTGNVHQAFKMDRLYIDPTEPAASYEDNGDAIRRVDSSSLRGFSDIWASAQDISFWDIGLAGGVLIHEAGHRAMVYAPWKLPDGTEVPAVAGWQFYHHRGLMDIKGAVPGFSSFLSRFTHSEELVCVTLLANREGVDFTNLGRRIAGAFGSLLSTNYDDNRLFLLEGQFSAADTVSRLKDILTKEGIHIFAEFDHAQAAGAVGLKLRPTTVLVFGNPMAGTGLMQMDQSISLELPLRISVWEDSAQSTWLAFPRLKQMAARYGLEDAPVVAKMEELLERLVRRAGNVY